MIRLVATVSSLAACWLWCSLAAAAGAAWPQWRGPDGQGHATASDLPVTWSETDNVAWKTPLPGRGWSSPVVDADHVWLTTAVDREASAEERARRLEGRTDRQPVAVSNAVTMRALAVDRRTGRLVHEIELFTVTDPQPVHATNSYASPSPVLADGRLICHFGDYGTACVDTATAKVVWTNRELRLNHENGPGSSPVVWHDLVIVHCDGSDVQFIAALDAATGRIAWKTPRSGKLHEKTDFKKAYGTPLVISVGGRDVLASPGADWLYGYDPATGRELWKLPYGELGFSIVPRPVVARGLLFMSTSFMQPQLLAVRIGDGSAAPEIAWREKKGVPSIPSPLVVGDELYLVSDKGIASCLDALTGSVRWSERLGGNFSSSPLFADGRIYVGNRDGETFVIEPGGEFRLLATNRLDGQIYATPAAVDREIYLRTDKAVYRLQKGGARP